MSVEQNKAALQRYLLGISRGDLSVIDEFAMEDWTYHGAPPGLPAGKAGFHAIMQMYLAAFPGMELSALQTVGEGDFIAARLRAHGTHGGEFMGIAPTGKPIDIEANTIMRFENGKVAEEWEKFDLLELLGQLGVNPLAASATS